MAEGNSSILLLESHDQRVIRERGSVWKFANPFRKTDCQINAVHHVNISTMEEEKEKQKEEVHSDHMDHRTDFLDEVSKHLINYNLNHM